MVASYPGSVLIKNGLLVDPLQGLEDGGHILVERGRIADILPIGSEHLPEADVVFDARNLIVSPGFVDIHTHVRYPGEPQKETIASCTSAAIRGGFTTICAMANTRPTIDTPESVERFIKVASDEARCEVKVLGAVTAGLRGQQATDASSMVSAGAVALSDDGKPVQSSEMMRSVLRFSRTTGVPISAHEELHTSETSGDHAEHLCWTCRGEAEMIRRDLGLLRETGGRLHIAHVSCAESVELLAAAQTEGLSVTCEATPHHLALDDRLINERSSVPSHHPLVKVNPPLRSSADVEAVRSGVAAGVITAIATDHAPHAGNDKARPYDSAAVGYTGLETALPLVLELVRGQVISLSTAIERLTRGPCEAFGLQKDGLQQGSEANICIFDPNAEWLASHDGLVSKGKNTPLLGRSLIGRVKAVMTKATLYQFGNDHELRALRAS